MPPPEDPPLRVFFALWPEPALAAALADQARRLAGECGGRVMVAATLHMTLAFVGTVPAARRGELTDAGASIRVPRFSFVLDRLGQWRDIVWAGAGDPPATLVGLADALREALTRRGFRLEARAFAPHLTLLRKARPLPALAPLPAREWRVTEFVLVTSQRSPAGSSYTRLAGWTLLPG